MWKRNPSPPAPLPRKRGEGRRRRAQHAAPLLLALLLMVMAAACNDDMAVQPKCQTLGGIDNFKDGACAQVPPEGAVAQDAIIGNDALSTGEVNGEFVTSFPIAITQAVLERGQNRYTIYCVVCHGQAGYGDGITTQYGFPAPPSYHSDTLRAAPDGFFFDVISNGYGRMYPYGAQLDVADRWAIVAYIRALQLSQHAPVSSLPQSDQEQLPQ